jgi:cytoskeletal protein CcmA (bactofilin family)
MAQIIRLRRSSVSGQKPTNSNLELGELALNTTDGKAFMAKSGSLGTSIEELIITNASNTGSINLSGSITLKGVQTITGSLIVTDGLGYIDTGLIAQNSDLILTSGSNLHVQDTGYISGSFRGDGSQLINIPISGVTGLNTTRIADGNATASISQTNGLRINTKTEITGSLKVSGSIYGDGSNLTNVGYTEKVFYVSEDGNDSNDGKTLNTSFRTIKVAAQAASASLALNPPNPFMIPIRPIPPKIPRLGLLNEKGVGTALLLLPKKLSPPIPLKPPVFLGWLAF